MYESPEAKEEYQGTAGEAAWKGAAGNHKERHVGRPLMTERVEWVRGIEEPKASGVCVRHGR